jgi:uncharacterized repeat protein (TIGR03803 family)
MPAPKLGGRSVLNISRRVARSVTLFLLLTILLTSHAISKTRETIIHSFTGGKDGKSPVSNLIFDSAGNLYGVALAGGKNQDGVAFELKLNTKGHWTETELYSFAGGSDGAAPEGGLVFDEAGNLYGVTSQGGGTGCSHGCGTVYELTRNAKGKWVESVLYAFTGGSDGGNPSSPLVMDQVGNLYGTTQLGGDASCDFGSCGTVFQLSPDGNGHWTETVIHAFAGGSDGAMPFLGGVIFDSSGNLYGTTSVGGTFDAGTVFELTPSQGGTWKETILYSFEGGTDGDSPGAGLVFFGGALYGTTYAGGNEAQPCPTSGCGTVFQLTLNSGTWTEDVIYAFQGTDGIETLATPVFDQAGNLYGTTFEGGSGPCSVCGTAFKLTPTESGPWQETVLQDFGSRRGDAGTPESGVVLDKSGNVFGTGTLGGKKNVGAVYKIAP